MHRCEKYGIKGQSSIKWSHKTPGTLINVRFLMSAQAELDDSQMLGPMIKYLGMSEIHSTSVLVLI